MAEVRKLDGNRLRDDLVTLHRLVTVYDLMVSRQKQFDTSSLGALLDLNCRLQHFVLDQRFPNGKSFGFEKGIGHGSADQKLVDFPINESVNNRDLVGDLSASQDGDERMFGTINNSPEVFELLLHQQPGCSFCYVFGYSYGRCVCAMRRAESVVHINVAQAGELLSKAVFVLFLFFVKP